MSRRERAWILLIRGLRIGRFCRSRMKGRGRLLGIILDLLTFMIIGFTVSGPRWRIWWLMRLMRIRFIYLVLLVLIVILLLLIRLRARDLAVRRLLLRRVSVPPLLLLLLGILLLVLLLTRARVAAEHIEQLLDYPYDLIRRHAACPACV